MLSCTHSDLLCSTSVVTDETGNMVEEIGYLPFGSTLFRNVYNGSTWESAYRFTGQEFDDENHLYNYGARLYDPIMSRFITPDTIVPNTYNPQSLNRYKYCLNNPLIYTDPSGHQEIPPEAYAAITAQINDLYEIWPQMGLIMQHDYLMGFNSFKTGFESGSPWGYDDYGRGGLMSPWERTCAIIALDGEIRKTGIDDVERREELINFTIDFFQINTKDTEIEYSSKITSEGRIIGNHILIGAKAFERSCGFLGLVISHEAEGHFRLNLPYVAGRDKLSQKWSF